MKKIIEQDRRVVVACDVDLIPEGHKIFSETSGLEEAGGYKIPMTSGEERWRDWTTIGRKFARNKALIYDPQKGGIDSPGNARFILSRIRRAGFDATIFHPDPEERENLKVWIETAREIGLGIIVGGYKSYVKTLGSEAKDQIYRDAIEFGIHEFIVPSTQPELCYRIRRIVEGAGVSEPDFYAVGLISQGGKIEDMLEIFKGHRLQGIFGGSIYGAENMGKSTREYGQQLQQK